MLHIVKGRQAELVLLLDSAASHVLLITCVFVLDTLALFDTWLQVMQSIKGCQAELALLHDDSISSASQQLHKQETLIIFGLSIEVTTTMLLQPMFAGAEKYQGLPG
jgi:hypothetical protein